MVKREKQREREREAERERKRKVSRVRENWKQMQTMHRKV
jgi:hypothetical protein